MKNYAIPLLLLLTSCKTYHYITPTINTAMYSGAGEVQAGLQFGSAGMAANGGVAISKNININGFASFFPETDNGYNSRELEFSLGYQINSGSNKKRATSFFLGLGSPWNAATAVPTPEAIFARASRFLNTPYIWGGRSVFGIDCSGFAQMVFRFFNIKLHRDAYQQATQGESVGFLQEARCGDLAFFDDDEGKITHVGILLNELEIIHASGKVRIDKIDNAGIVNTDTQQRTHKLRIIKRYF